MSASNKPEKIVLIMDDHPLMRSTFSKIMQQHNGDESFPYQIKVLRAETPSAALELMKVHKIDGLITDYQSKYPNEMNGLKFIEAAQDAGFTGPTILISSQAMYKAVLLPEELARIAKGPHKFVGKDEDEVILRLPIIVAGMLSQSVSNKKGGPLPGG